MGIHWFSALRRERAQRVAPRDAAARHGPAARADLLLAPAVILFLAALSLALLAGLDRISARQRGHLLQIDATLDMLIHTTTFHVLLEEHLNARSRGIPAEGVREIWAELDGALRRGDALLHGGVTKYGLNVPPFEEAGLRSRAELLGGQLQELGALAAVSLEEHARTGSPSDPEEPHDRLLRDFRKQAYELETAIEQGAVRSRRTWRRLALGLISLWTLTVGLATLALYRRQHGRLRAELELLDTRKELERSNRELESRVREKTESLETANAVLSRNIAEVTRAQGELLDYQDRLRGLSYQLTLVEERERRRLATVLHDQIGTNLAFAKLKLAAVAAPGPAAGAPREVAESLELIERAIEDTRTLTLELSPPVLYEMGLVPALEWLAERMERRHGIRVDVDDDGLPKAMAEDVRVLVFHAVRELLVNVVKHAEAARVRIECRRDDRDLRISVVDDGRGFREATPFAPATSRGAFGLFSVRERLGSLGGAIEIEGGAAGSSVTILVPLELGDRGDDSP